MAGEPEDLGAPDPEFKNSPVAWEEDEDTETLRQSIPGEAVCFFNGETYPHDMVIKSGTALLRCDRGLWVQAGSSDPDNP